MERIFVCSAYKLSLSLLQFKQSQFSISSSAFNTKDHKHIFKFIIDIKSKNLACILILKLTIFKLKKEQYLIVNDESFVLKTSLILTIFVKMHF